MKKNLHLKNILAGALTASLIISATAFAVDKGVLISPANPVNTEETANSQEKAYNLVSGKVESITQEDGYKTISITNDNMGMVFTVEKDVFVVDSKDNSYKTLEDIKEGDEITALLKNDSVMTMSIPPMTPGAAGFVINSEGSFVDVSVYNDELVNLENTLKLNIDEKTTITDITGSKKIFTADDVKNSEALVIYGASTRSIPAQTSPSFVMIVNNEELSADNTENLDKTETSEIEATPLTEATPVAETTPVADATPVKSISSLVPIRQIADNTGFTIIWTANDKPVILEKDNKKIVITVGEQTYITNGKEVNLNLATTFNTEDEKIYVDSTLEEILKTIETEK